MSLSRNITVAKRHLDIDDRFVAAILSNKSSRVNLPQWLHLKLWIHSEESSGPRPVNPLLLDKPNYCVHHRTLYFTTRLSLLPDIFIPSVTAIVASWTSILDCVLCAYHCIYRFY
jgi:hypothetical protein